MPVSPPPRGGTGMTRTSPSDAAPDLPVPARTTSLLVLRDGVPVLRVGDLARPGYVASVRKSLLSLLYGIEVSRGTIGLDQTLEDLGVTDSGGLLPLERTARVRDLLTSRSGVYHAPSTPGSDEAAFPERGSRPPGSHFVYNNWDFNALGAIFERATGRTVLEAFETSLAGPLGFEDHDPRRQRLLGDVRRSAIPAFHFFLSARDLARVGLLLLAGGEWEGRQLVPADWLAESLRPHVLREDMPPGTGFGTCDYGYLWWLPREHAAGWRGAALAAGNFGQFLLVLPEVDAVIVHRRHVSDEFAIARNSTPGVGAAPPTPRPVTFEEFLVLARAVVRDVLLPS